MLFTFYTAAVVAILATVLAITRTNVVHALLYLIVSLVAVAVIFYVVGAPFVAALEVIIYAGAIMVLFVFVVMLLNLGPQSVEQERGWLTPGIWIGPAVLTIVLVAEVSLTLASGHLASTGPVVDSQRVGVELFGRYAVGVEIASMLLLSGLIGAYHLGRRAVERR